MHCASFISIYKWAGYCWPICLHGVQQPLWPALLSSFLLATICNTSIKAGWLPFVPWCCTTAGRLSRHLAIMSARKNKKMAEKESDRKPSDKLGIVLFWLDLSFGAFLYGRPVRLISRQALLARLLLAPTVSPHPVIPLRNRQADGRVRNEPRKGALWSTAQQRIEQEVKELFFLFYFLSLSLSLWKRDK